MRPSTSPVAQFSPLAHASMIRRKLERDRNQLNFSARGTDRQTKLAGDRGGAREPHRY